MVALVCNISGQWCKSNALHVWFLNERNDIPISITPCSESIFQMDSIQRSIFKKERPWTKQGVETACIWMLKWSDKALNTFTCRSIIYSKGAIWRIQNPRQLAFKWTRSSSYSCLHTQRTRNLIWFAYKSVYHRQPKSHLKVLLQD